MSGGPAFPSHGSMGEVAQEGMTLRDYFAAHGDQPGVSEIVAVAGLTYRNNKVWMDSETGMPFTDWWETMPLYKRLDLSAKVRFAQADAMLRARDR